MTDSITKERTLTTGIGTYTLDGVAMTGFRTFAAAIAAGHIIDGDISGETVDCLVTNGVQRELVRGSYSAAAGTLTRGTILASTKAGAPINWSPGPKEVTSIGENLLASLLSDVTSLGDNLVLSGSELLSTGDAQLRIDIEDPTMGSLMVAYLPGGFGKARSTRSKLRETVSVGDNNAVGDETDETAKWQEIIDYFSLNKPLTLLVPNPVGEFHKITNLRMKNDSLEIEGYGGKQKIVFGGTAAQATAIIRADYEADHDYDYFNDLHLKNLQLDGDGKALWGFYGNGFTRRCSMENVEILSCVNPLKLVNAFYARLQDVECQFTPRSCPSGMNEAVYVANLYGVYIDIAHIIEISKLYMSNIGGDSSNSYIAALWARSSEGVTIKELALENMQRTVNTRYLSSLVILEGGTTITMIGGYQEETESNDEAWRYRDNSSIVKMGGHLNDVKHPELYQLEALTPFTVINETGENMDIVNRVYANTAAGEPLRGTRRINCTYAAGPVGEFSFDGGATTYSKQGLLSDTILVDAGPGATESTMRGYRSFGYSAALITSDTKIRVQWGKAMNGGEPVMFGRHSGLPQDLAPQLSYVGAWNLKISPIGTPFCEKQAASVAGSYGSIRFGTFNTNGTIITDLLLFDEASQRLVGTIDGPLGNRGRYNRTIKAYRNGVASGAAINIATATFAAAANKEDWAKFKITVDAVITDTEDISMKNATWRAAASWDKDQAGSVNNETASVAGTLDPDVASFGAASGGAFASNVYTATGTFTNADSHTMDLELTLEINGAKQTETALAIASGWTLMV